MKSKLFAIVTGLVALAIPVLAHHSFAAEYDANKTRDFTGKVTKVEWMNPHARFYVDIVENGKTTNWEFELGSPNGLMRQGWTRNSMKIGDEVKVQGNLAKDGSNLANARFVTLGDGRRLFAGSTTDGGPTAPAAGKQ